MSTYTFDGIVPGRTWELLPGDTLQVDLINDLPLIEHPHDLSQPFATEGKFMSLTVEGHDLNVLASGGTLRTRSRYAALGAGPPACARKTTYRAYRISGCRRGVRPLGCYIPATRTSA